MLVPLLPGGMKLDLTNFLEILNLEGHPNHITGSRVTAILLNVWILPIGHSGFWSNLDQFCSKLKCICLSLKLFLMAKLGLQGISY